MIGSSTKYGIQISKIRNGSNSRHKTIPSISKAYSRTTWLWAGCKWATYVSYHWSSWSGFSPKGLKNATRPSWYILYYFIRMWWTDATLLFVKVCIPFYEVPNLNYFIFCRRCVVQILYTVYWNIIRTIVGGRQSLRLAQSHIRYTVMKQIILQIAFLSKTIKLRQIVVQFWKTFRWLNFWRWIYMYLTALTEEIIPIDGWRYGLLWFVCR